MSPGAVRQRTWYGLHQIRGVFWTLRCLHKPCVKPCFSCIECSSHYIDADHAILGQWAVGVPVCGLYLPILMWPTRLFLSKDLGAIWTWERHFTPQCGEQEYESGNGRGSEVNKKGITSTCNWHCGGSWQHCEQNNFKRSFLVTWLLIVQ